MVLKTQSPNTKHQPTLHHPRSGRSELTEQLSSFEIVQPKRVATGLLLPHDMVHLQRAIGNQAVGKLLNNFQHDYKFSTDISNHSGVPVIQLSPEDDIRQELRYRFQPNEFARISARKERLKQIFLSLNQADAQHFYDRLSLSRNRQDDFAKLFWGSLAHTTCQELLAVLRQKLQSHNQPSEETQSNSVQMRDDKEPLDPTHDWRSDPQYAECVKNGETKNNEKIPSKDTLKKGATNCPLRGKGSGGKATMSRGSGLCFQRKWAG